MGKERPIIFTTESVKAILDGRKTMTRRLNKLGEYNQKPDDWLTTPTLNPSVWAFYKMASVGVKDLTRIPCPYGQVGDRLWVREKYALKPQYDLLSAKEVVELYGIRKDIYYETLTECFWIGKTRSSIFMPRWASRLTLEITGLRAERLQEIRGKDCILEGIPYSYPDFPAGEDEIQSYILLWNSLNAKRGFGWCENPWVWVIKFGNIGVRVK